MDQITIIKPDDWHLHLRDAPQMESVVMLSARYYQRALIMPNLASPIFDLSRARRYRERILSAVTGQTDFQPLIALYLTGDTKVEQIREARESGIVLAVKLYPAGATTNSAQGVQNIDQCDSVFESMQEIGMPLSIHGEVTDPAVDIFDREKVFIDRVLAVLVARYPKLKIVLEHITTKEAVQFIESSSPNLAGTITAHHLLLNRNDVLVGGIQPHHYCLPIVKTEEDRKEVLRAAISGNPKFFLGTDSAPHSQTDKESGIGKAGIFSAPVSLSIYAELFDKENRLDRLENFASCFGADFYALPRNRETIVLKRESMIVPETYGYSDNRVVPLKAGEHLKWRVEI